VSSNRTREPRNRRTQILVLSLKTGKALGVEVLPTLLGGAAVATRREGHRSPRLGRDSANAITVPKAKAC
jgi:hypothetical protein